jgi:hypothetical protein
VDDDELVVQGAMDVELDIVGAGRLRDADGRQRVLRSERGGAAVAADAEAEWS